MNIIVMSWIIPMIFRSIFSANCVLFLNFLVGLSLPLSDC